MAHLTTSDRGAGAAGGVGQLPQPAAPLTARDKQAGASRSLSVVIPVYNSVGSLRLLCERLEPVLRDVSRDFEVILVNDASRDGSWQVIEELTREHGWVHGIDLMRNYGQHNALLCGVRAARFEVIATMDDDLQHPPEELPKLLAALDQGYDVVYGSPVGQQHGLLRNAASRLTKLTLQATLGAQTARQVSAFRVFRTMLRAAFADYRNTYVSLDVLLTWGGQRFTAVAVRHDPRTIGTSNYSLFKLLRHALNMMTGFSTLPLRMASLVGFSFTLFGIGVLAYVLIRYVVSGGSIPGFPFLASIIAIFSGAQLFALGILGEYLARMHTRLMDRPSYVVRSVVHEGARDETARLDD
jgi:glycosyltransferase involved in cell wall biosynthesis